MDPNGRCFFDFETVANPAAVALLPDPTPPSNYKDPDKIAAWVADKKAAAIESAALDPDLGAIAAVSWLVYGDPAGQQTLLVDEDVPDEAALLRAFWKVLTEKVGAHYLVGYNILGFDLPWLMRRSMAHGIPANWPMKLSKYQVDPITDLYGILYNWQPGKGLKTVAALHNIPNPLAGLDGSMFPQMPPDLQRQYVGNDVQLCVHLFNLMNGIYF